MAKGVHLTLRLSLREGSVYYFDERGLSSEKSHFFIVLNQDPLAQEVLVLAVVTSKVESVKLRRRGYPATLVELGPADLPGILSLPSIVDANSLRSVPLAEFNARFVAKEIQSFSKDLAPALRDALCRAVHASVVVSEEVKSLVRQS